MHAFKDKSGTEWKLSLDVGIMEDAKDCLDIDLLDPLGEESKTIVSIAPIEPANISRFCKLLKFLCKEEIDSRGISEPQFARLLDSTTIRDAYDAFFTEWQDFFQSLGREDLAEAMMKIRDIMKEGVMKVIVEIQKTKYPTGSLSTSSPESSE
jgi:hypothetical protein